MTMKLISFISFKGGAGKSTALMAIASALVEAGHKIALFEADENRPLTGWHGYASKTGTWDADLCTIYDASSEEAAASAFEAAENAGCTMALADTAGGGSELNTLMISSAQLVIIPTAMTTIDLDDAISTFNYALKLYELTGDVIPTRLLITRLAATRLTSAERGNLEIVAEVPQFETRLAPRSAYADIKSLGMLHLYEAELMKVPSKRMVAGHIRIARGEARALTNEMLSLI